MPHPIDSVKPSGVGGPIVLSMDIVSRERPELAAAMLSVITNWAYVEFEIGNTLLALYPKDAKAEIEEFLRVPNSTRQREILVEKAKERMTPEHLSWLEALLMMTASDYRQRNRLCHWLSGVAFSIPDGILLENPEVLLRHELVEQDWNEQVEEAGRKKDMQFFLNMRELKPRLSRRHIFVYQMRDFEGINKNFKELKQGFRDLRWLMSPRTSKRDQVQAQLYSLPRFQPTLSRLRARPSTPPKALHRRWREAARRLLTSLCRHLQMIRKHS